MPSKKKTKKQKEEEEKKEEVEQRIWRTTDKENLKDIWTCTIRNVAKN